MAGNSTIQPAPKLLTAKDWFDPILTREIQQITKSKVFLITTGLALLAILLSALFFAAQSASNSNFSGFVAFQVTLSALAPLLFFVVPFNAVISMRQEVASGTSELLFLSKLKPRQIVLGKLQSSFVQILLYLSVFAPLTAMTFFLRGVTVLDIGISLALATELSILAISVALLLGAFCRYPILSSSMRAIAGLAFAIGTFGIWGFLAQDYTLSLLLRETVFRWEFHAVFSGICIFGTLLFSQCASSLLTHPFENRSSVLRILAAAGVILAFSLTALMVERRYWYDAGPAVCIGCMVCLAPFFLFSTSEESGFSPRTRLQVPRSRLGLWLSLPFLPGGGRGLVFSLIMIFISSAGAFVLYEFSAPLRHHAANYAEKMFGITAAFVFWALVFALGSSILRSIFPKGVKYNWITRIAWALSFGIIHFLLIMALKTDMTGEERAKFYYVLGGCLALILFLISVPRMLLGIEYAQRISAEKRARQQKEKKRS